MFHFDNFKQRILNCLPADRPYKLFSLKSKYFDLIFDVCRDHLPFTYWPIKLCLNRAFKELKEKGELASISEICEFEKLITEYIFSYTKLDFDQFLTKESFALLIKSERVKRQNWYDTKAKQMIPDLCHRLYAVIKHEAKVQEFINKALELFEQRNNRPENMELYLQVVIAELISVCNSRRIRINILDLYPGKYNID